MNCYAIHDRIIGMDPQIGFRSRDDKVYSVTWAAFVAVCRHSAVADAKTQIGKLVFSAMGAGSGGVSYTEVARQMAAGYHHNLNPPHRMDWDTVIERHKAIAYDGDEQVAR